MDSFKGSHADTFQYFKPDWAWSSSSSLSSLSWLPASWSRKPCGNQTCLKMCLFLFEFLPIESDSWNTAAIHNKCLTNGSTFPLLEISFQLPFRLLDGRLSKKGDILDNVDWTWVGNGMDVMRRDWQQFERLGIRSAAILSDQSTDKPMPLMMVMLMVMVMMTMTMMVMKKARRPSVCWVCPAFWLSTLVGGGPTWTDKSQRHTNQLCFVTQWNNENWSKSTICRYEMHCWE